MSAFDDALVRAMASRCGLEDPTVLLRALVALEIGCSVEVVASDQGSAGRMSALLTSLCLASRVDPRRLTFSWPGHAPCRPSNIRLVDHAAEENAAAVSASESAGVDPVMEQQPDLHRLQYAKDAILRAVSDVARAPAGPGVDRRVRLRPPRSDPLPSSTRTMAINPTDLAHRRANVRGHDRERQRHGAATDPASIAAYREATAERRAATSTTAVRVGRQPRGFSLAEHEHAEELRREAAHLAEIAAAKTVPEQRRLVEREVAQLEARAEAIVPLEHARAGWR